MSKKQKASQNNKSKMSDKERIKDLTRENQRLKREIGLLKGEIENGKPSALKLLRKQDAVTSTFLHQARRENTFSQDGYLSYLWKGMKNASVFRIYSNILNTVKHLTFITTTIQVIVFILAIVKSSAIFIISASAFIVSLPFIILVSGTGAFLTFLGRKRATKTNRPLLTGKDVYVFFPAKKSAMRPDSYFAGLVKSFSNRENTVCVIVTQGLFFSRGIGNKSRYFFTSKVDAPNIIVVRRHYYFELKQKIIIPLSHAINEIY